MDPHPIKKREKTEQSIYPIPLTCFQPFPLISYCLARLLKLMIRVFSFLSLRGKTSLLSARFFMIIARLNYGIKLNQNMNLRGT